MIKCPLGTTQVPHTVQQRWKQATRGVSFGVCVGGRPFFCPGKPLAGPFGYTKVKLASGPEKEEANLAALGRKRILAQDTEGL